MFIDTKISKMNESFAYIFSFNIILISCEPCQAFFKHIDPQGIIACYHNIDSQVIFKVIYQMRVEYVLGNKDVFLVLYLSFLCHHLYPSSAGLVCRLHYPKLILICCLLSCYLKTVIICWK